MEKKHLIMTILRKLVPRKNKLLVIFRKIPLILGMFGLILCIGLYKEYRGFDQGTVIAQQNCLHLTSSSFSAGVLRVYEDFSNRYYSLVWCFLFYIIGKCIGTKFVSKFSGKKIISQIFCITSLIIGLTQIIRIFGDKSSRLPETIGDPFDNLLRNSIAQDWICLVIVIVLIAHQATMLFINKGGFVENNQ